MNDFFHTLILKVASRYLQGNFAKQLDELARCQALEGAAGVKMGVWSRNPRRGLKKAREELPQVDESWFQPSRMYSDCLSMVNKVIGNATALDPSGIMNDGMMGLWGDGKTQTDTSAIFWSVGTHKSKGILNGKETVAKAAAVAVQYSRNRAIRDLKGYRRQQKRQSPEYDPMGEHDVGISVEEQVDKVKDYIYKKVDLDPFRVMGELMASNSKAGLEFRSFILKVIDKTFRSSAETEMAIRWFDYVEKNPQAPKKQTALLKALGYEWEPGDKGVEQMFSRVKTKLHRTLPRAIKNSPKITKLIEEYWFELAKEYGVRLARLLTAVLQSYRGRVASDTSLVQKLAQRHLQAALSKALEMVARAQVLEGAAGLTPGTWSNRPRQGLVKAQQFLSEHEVDPEWFQPTDLYKTALGTMQTMYNKSGMTQPPEDLLQNSMAGIGMTGKKILPLFWDVGKKRGKRILNGKETPEKILPTVVTYAHFRAMTYMKTLKRQKKKMYPEMEGQKPQQNVPTLLYTELNEKNQYDLIAEALTGRDQLGKKLRGFCLRVIHQMKPAVAEYGVQWMTLIARNGKAPKKREILYSMGREVTSKDEMAVGRAIAKVAEAIRKAVLKSKDIQNTMQSLLTQHELSKGHSGYKVASPLLDKWLR